MSNLGALAPGVFLSLLLGTLYGALGHLVLGRRWTRLPWFVLAGIGGCLLAWVFDLHLLRRFPAPGGLPLIEASVVAWLLLLLVAAWRGRQ